MMKRRKEEKEKKRNYEITISWREMDGEGEEKKGQKKRRKYVGFIDDYFHQAHLKCCHLKL